MVQAVEACSACNRTLGPEPPRRTWSYNDVGAFNIHLLICTVCRRTWSPMKAGRVLLNVAKQLTKYIKTDH